MDHQQWKLLLVTRLRSRVEAERNWFDNDRVKKKKMEIYKDPNKDVDSDGEMDNKYENGRYVCEWILKETWKSTGKWYTVLWADQTSWNV